MKAYSRNTLQFCSEFDKKSFDTIQHSMRIVYIHKADFEKRPPVISAVMILNDLGHKVTVIDEHVSEYWQSVFGKRGIESVVIPQKKAKGKIEGGLYKAYSYYNFGKKVKSYLKRILQDGEKPLLWIEGAQTIMSLGAFIKDYKYILQIQELHNQSKSQMKAIGNVIREAEHVFMPEYNRTVMYKVWFNLQNYPTVLPNKPYFTVPEDNMRELEKKYAEELEVFNKYKIILYQGWVSRDRDVSAIIKAVKELGSEFRVALLGKDTGIVSEYKEIDPNIIHIPFIPAPDYLAFTANAYIGILSYEPDCLNSAYCAPNKIYEYSQYGLPMIGNRVPGLKYSIEDSKSGITVDLLNQDAVKRAIMNIDSHYSVFSEQSRAFYNSVDNKGTIRDVLKKIHV